MLDSTRLSRASKELRADILLLGEELRRRVRVRRILTYYPDDGPFRRELYPKHMEFFEAGRDHKERLMLAANRIGKTEGCGGYEVALHLTGRYPDWWCGKRFDGPIRAWVAGKTNETTRDIIQRKLLGDVSFEGTKKRLDGTGLIWGDSISDIRWKQGVNNLVDSVTVRHISGGNSTLGIKSYEQGRGSFEGTEQHVIWLDEEPPLDVYTECLVRTMTTQGLVLCTFTPLEGMSEVVLHFLPGGKLDDAETSNRKVVMATWDDVPHLSERDKAMLWESIPPYQRDARSKGIPQLGSGAIYPVAESDFVVAPFEIPVWWPRVYGLDVGWNRTAAVWGAWDRDDDVLYVYSEHYRGQAEPVIHAESIRSRGQWIPGVIDPASRGRGQKDGEQLLRSYLDLGLDILPAVNAVESGIHKVWMRMSTGRLKVFSSCQSWLQEYRLYRRDEDGNIVKENDHLMDATRYLVMSGLPIARCVPNEDFEEYGHEHGRSAIGGY